MTDWGAIILGLMKKHRVTQRRLEAVAGVSRSTLKRFIAGKSSISIDGLEAMLSAMGYSLNLEQTGEPSPLVTRPRKIHARPVGIRRPLVRAAGMERF